MARNPETQNPAGVKHPHNGRGKGSGGGGAPVSGGGGLAEGYQESHGGSNAGATRRTWSTVYRAAEAGRAATAANEAVRIAEKAAEPSLQRIRNAAAEKYERQASKHIARKAYEYTDDGDLVTKTKKITTPVLKERQSERKVVRASERLDKKLDEIKATTTPREFKQIETQKRGEFALRHYRLTPQGKLKTTTKTVEEPKLAIPKPRLKRQIEEMRQTSQDIRKGKHGQPKNPLAVKQPRTPTEKTFQGTLLGEESPFEKGVRKQLKKAPDNTPWIKPNHWRERLIKQIDGSEDMDEDTKAFMRGAAYFADDRRDYRRRLNEKAAEQRQEAKEAQEFSDTLGDISGGMLSADPVQSAFNVAFPGVATVDKAFKEITGGPGSLNYGMEAALRPSAIAENIQARVLRDVIHDDDWKGKDIPSIKEAAIYGFNKDNAVTGGDIMESIGLPKQLGLVNDILTDPLTYVGFGGAASKAASRAALLETKLLKDAPDLLKSADYLRFSQEAANTGDFEKVLAHLDDVARKNNIKLRAWKPSDLLLRSRVRRGLRGKGPYSRDTRAADLMAARIEKKSPDYLADDSRYAEAVANANKTGDYGPLNDYLRAASEEVGVRVPTIAKRTKNINQRILSPADDAELFAKAASDTRNAPTTSFNRKLLKDEEQLRLPGRSGQIVGRNVLRSAARNRTYDPAVEFRLLSPLGRRIGGLRVPKFVIPENRAFLPTGLAPRHLRTLAIQRQLSELRSDADNIAGEIARKEQALKDLGPGHAVERRRINRDIKTLKENLTRQRSLLASRIKASASGRLTPREFAEHINRTNSIHELQRTIFAQTRNAEARVQHHLRKSGIGKLSDASMVKVTLFRNFRADTGATAELRQVLGPLTEREQHAADALDVIEKQIGRSDVEAGVLGRILPDYVARRAQDTGTVMGHEADSALQGAQDVSSGIGGNLGTPAFGRARSEAEMSSLADPELLTEALEIASRGKLDRTAARNFAEQWYESGTIRRYSDTLLRRLQRQGRVPETEVTRADERALQYDDPMESGPGYFRWAQEMDDEGKPVGERFVELSPEIEREGIVRNPLEATNMSELEERTAKFYSAQIDKQFYENAPVLREAPDSPVAIEYQEQIDALQKEIDEIALKLKEYGKSSEARANLNAALAKAEAASAGADEFARNTALKQAEYDAARATVEDLEAKLAKSRKTRRVVNHELVKELEGARDAVLKRAEEAREQFRRDLEEWNDRAKAKQPAADEAAPVHDEAAVQEYLDIWQRAGRPAAPVTEAERAAYKEAERRWKAYEARRASYEPTKTERGRVYVQGVTNDRVYRKTDRDYTHAVVYSERTADGELLYSIKSMHGTRAAAEKSAGASGRYTIHTTKRGLPPVKSARETNAADELKAPVDEGLTARTVSAGTGGTETVRPKDLSVGESIRYQNQVRRITGVERRQRYVHLTFDDGREVSFGHSKQLARVRDEAALAGPRPTPPAPATVTVGGKELTLDQLDPLIEKAKQGRKVSARDALKKQLKTARGQATRAKKALLKARRAESGKRGRVTYANKVVDQARRIYDQSAPVPFNEVEPWIDHAFQSGSHISLDRMFQLKGETPRFAHEEEEVSKLLPGQQPRNPDDRSFVADVFDRFPDTRKGGVFYDMNPSRVTVRRQRQGGVKAAQRAVISAIDNQHGVSAEEVAGHVGFVRRGDELIRVHIEELKPDFAANGDQVAWIWNRDGDTVKLGMDQVSVPKAFVPTQYDAEGKAASLWYNPEDGYEYAYPETFAFFGDSPIGTEIQNVVGKGRLWRTTDLLDYYSELVWANGKGGTAYQAIYDNGVDLMQNRVMGMFRYGVTMLFPAYHIRNIVSDVFKTLQADSGVVFHPLAAAKLTVSSITAGKAVRKVALPGVSKAVPIEEALFVMDMYGIRSTQHLAEFAHLAAGGKEPGAIRRKLRWINPGPKGALGGKLIEYGARREDIIRYITFAQRMRRNGGDVADATWYMIKHHFDYGDLSAFERQRMRNLFLFYTWYRKNIPLQFMELLTRPGFFAGVASSYSSIQRGESPININWSHVDNVLLNADISWFDYLPNLEGRAKNLGMIPDYMTSQLGGLAVNWNGHTAVFATGAPWVDMNLIWNLKPGAGGDIDASLHQAASMLNPMITTAAQMITGQDLLVGRDYYEQEPVSGAMGEIVSMLGMAPGDTDQYGRALVPWRLSVLLGQVPFLGRFQKYFVDTTRASDSGFMGSDTGRLITSNLGFNTMIFPKGPGEAADQAAEKRLRDIVGERESYRQSIGNLPDAQQEKKMEQYEYEVMIPDILRSNIPRDIVRKYPETFLYKTEEERMKNREEKFPSRFKEDSEKAPAWQAGEVGSTSDSTWQAPEWNPKSGVKDSEWSAPDLGGTDTNEPSFEKPERSSSSKKDRSKPEPLAPHPPDPYLHPEIYGIDKGYKGAQEGRYSPKSAARTLSRPIINAAKLIKHQTTGPMGGGRPSPGPTQPQGRDTTRNTAYDLGGNRRPSDRLSEPRRGIQASMPNAVFDPSPPRGAVRDAFDDRYKREPIPYPDEGPASVYAGTAAVNSVLRMIEDAKSRGITKDTDAEARIIADPKGDPNVKAAIRKGYEAVNRVLTLVNAPKDKQVVTLAKEYVKAYNKAQPSIDGKEYAKLGPDAAEMAAAAVKYGKENGVDPAVLMSIGRIESGFGANNGPSSAGAQGQMQFIPSTRDMILEKYGVDAYGGPTEAVEAASLLLKDAGYADSPYDAIFSYNHADWYVNDVQNGAKEFSELNSASPGKGKATPIPTRLRLEARSVIGKQGLRYLKEGGKVVNMKDAPKGQKLQTEELFYDQDSKYYDTSSGGWVEGQFGDHSDHVHFASKDPISMMLVIKHAQDIGLLQPGMGENPIIDTIDAPAHTDASLSFHNMTEPLPDTKQANRLYKQIDGQGNEVGQAVDLASGDPALMDEMRSWIEKHMSEGVNPYAGAVEIKGTDLGIVPPPEPTSSTTAAPSTGVPSTSAPAPTSSGAPTPSAPVIRGGRGGRGGMIVRLPKRGTTFSFRQEDLGSTSLNDYYGILPTDESGQTTDVSVGYGLTPEDIREIADIVEDDQRRTYGF